MERQKDEQGRESPQTVKSCIKSSQGRRRHSTRSI